MYFWDFFFFFKQKTAYEMRISDWSSDVCSSDLLHIGIDMAAWWSADDAFLASLRDKEVLTALVAEVGGDEVAVANAKEKGATLKTIVRDHLDGSNGRKIGRAHV